VKKLDNLVTKSAPGPSAERQRGVDRVVDIFEELLKTRRPMRIGDLARQLAAPRSTLYNLVNRLVEAELLEFSDDQGSVFFGRTMHLYGAAYAEANPLQLRAREVLEALAAKTDATAQLCALRGNKYVVLDSRSGRGPFRIMGDIGVPVPLPWTASGRLLLDRLSPQEIASLIPPEDYILPDGRRVDSDQFLEDVERARSEGFCLTTGLSDQFACCLAAPIRNARRNTIATLCFVTPIETMEERQPELKALLLEGAARLSSVQFPG
jgi:DNA-binding IclR family transcriptional regulator